MEEERRKVAAIVEEQNRRVQEEMESAPNAEALAMSAGAEEEEGRNQLVFAKLMRESGFFCDMFCNVREATA
jgi:hypothetical protein